MNFTKARFDSIRPGRHSVLLILPENPGKSPQPGHLNWDTSTKSPQPRHLNHDTSTKIVQNLDSKMVLIIFASYDTRQPSAWRQTHEAQTGATCANKRGKRTRRKQAQTGATSANKRGKRTRRKQAKHVRTSANKRTRRKQVQHVRTNATSARGPSKRKQPSQPGPSKRKQAQANMRKHAQTRQEQYQNLRTVWRKTP